MLCKRSGVVFSSFVRVIISPADQWHCTLEIAALHSSGAVVRILRNPPWVSGYVFPPLCSKNSHFSS